MLDTDLMSETRDCGMNLGFGCWKCKSEGRYKKKEQKYFADSKMEKEKEERIFIIN